MKKCIIILSLTLLGLIACSDNSLDFETILTDQVPYPTTPKQVVDTEGSGMVLGKFNLLEEATSYSDNRDSGIEIISMEEAATIGANSLLEILGENLEGKYMQLWYNHNPHVSRMQNTWVGEIAYYPENLEKNHHTHLFRIDAITGEVLDLRRQLEPLHNIDFFTMQAMTEDELWELFPKPDEIEIETMLEIVTRYAQRYFNNSLEVSVELGIYGEDDIDIIDSPTGYLYFIAIDGTGHVVEVAIQRETNQLAFIGVPLTRFI